MPTQLLGITVMISGPGDTMDDVATVRDTIHTWNDDHSRDQRVVFLPKHFSNAVSVYEHGVDGQVIINRQITNRSDVVVCLFRHRLGTPTPRSEDSGTVEEADIGVANGSAHVLFFTGSIPPEVVNDRQRRGQFDKLTSFKESFTNKDSYKGLYGSFGSKPELIKTIEAILWEHARSADFTALATTGAAPTQEVTLPRLSINAHGPIWRLNDRETVINVIAQQEGETRNRRNEWTEQFIESAKSRGDELDEKVAANAGQPITVTISTEAVRVTDLEVEITFPDAFGVYPADDDWRDVWRLPQPKNTIYDTTFIGSSMPRGTLPAWNAWSSWMADGDDIIVTVTVKDLRKGRRGESVEDDVVIWLPSETDCNTASYTWTASGDYDGRAVQWAGDGSVDVIARDDSMHRLVRWGQGRSNRPDDDQT